MNVRNKLVFWPTKIVVRFRLFETYKKNTNTETVVLIFKKKK